MITIHRFHINKKELHSVAGAICILMVILGFGGPIASHFLSTIGMVKFIESSTYATSDVGMYLLRPDSGVQGKTQLEGAFRLNPNNRRVMLWLGFMYWKEEQQLQAFGIWKTAGYDGSMLSQWADWLRLFDTPSNAEQWYRASIGLDPKWADSWYYIGIEESRREEWTQALDSFQKALDGHLSNIGMGDVYLRLGFVYQNAAQYKDFDKAIDLYNTALATDHFSDASLEAEAYYKRGELLQIEGQGQEIVAENFRNALQLAPYHRWAKIRLAMIEYNQNKDINYAVTQLQDALERWPEDSSKKWPYIYLGNLYQDAEMIEQAKQAYFDALVYSPNDGEIIGYLDDLGATTTNTK